MKPPVKARWRVPARSALPKSFVAGGVTFELEANDDADDVHQFRTYGAKVSEIELAVWTHDELNAWRGTADLEGDLELVRVHAGGYQAAAAALVLALVAKLDRLAALRAELG